MLFSYCCLTGVEPNRWEVAATLAHWGGGQFLLGRRVLWRRGWGEGGALVLCALRPESCRFLVSAKSRVPGSKNGLLTRENTKTGPGSQPYFWIYLLMPAYVVPIWDIMGCYNPRVGCTGDLKVSFPSRSNVSLWDFKGKLTLRSSVQPAPVPYFFIFFYLNEWWYFPF